MEIVIENPRESSSRHALPPPEYFASLASQRLQLGGGGPELEGPTPVRRVDRSGLLEMPVPNRLEATPPRRVDRSGLLESVSEVPSTEDRVAYAKARLAGPVTEERHLTGAERGPNSTMTLGRLRGREKRGNAESRAEEEGGGCFGVVSRGKPAVQAPDGPPARHVEQMVARFSPVRTPTPSELKSRGEALGGLSPRPRNGDRLASSAALSIPDVIEAHEPPPTTNGTGNGGPRTPGSDGAPEGERAEAEGCEHTAIESLEEGRVSFKGQKKVLQQNDNSIQTLRVIILSEQL